MRRFGEPVDPGRTYRQRLGAYAVILDGEDVLVTEQADPEPEFQLPGGGVDPGEGMLPALLKDHAWTDSAALSDALKPVLLRLSARYLLSTDQKNKPLDPVARFHLSNGAEVYRLNWMGDRSRNGLKQSAGLMVNYLYRLDDIDQNHERFVRDGTIAASGEVRRQADF